MTLREQTFESASLGSVTGTNPPAPVFDTRSVSGTGSLQVENSTAMHGSQAMSSSQSSTATSDAYGRWSSLGASQAACRFYWRASSVPTSGSQPIHRVDDSSGVQVLSLQVDSSGHLVLQVSNSATVIWTSPSALSANTWYRFEWLVTALSPTVGAYKFDYYLGDSTSPVSTGYTTTTGNTGTAANIDRCRFGKIAGTVANTYYYDDIAFNDGASAYIGPVATAPVASFTQSETALTLSVDGTGSTASSPNTISSYDWDWGDGTTHGTGSTATHTYSAGNTYTVVLTVTDSASQTGTASQTVTVAPPAGTVTAQTVDSAVGWTPSGGTALSCITDGDPSTFVTSSAPPTGQEFDFTLKAMTVPAAGQPVKVFLTMDAPLSTSASLAAQFGETISGSFTQRSSVTGVSIAAGSGGSVTNVVTLTFPWTDVQNMTTGGWNAPRVKLQVTAS